MKIGFIGAGNVAQTYAKYFARHGHEIVLSNSRGPDSLAEIVRPLGPKVRAGTAVEAARQDIVILAVRWEQARSALAQVPDWQGRILVDATNRPNNEASSQTNASQTTASETIASYAPGARLVKALNTLVVNWIPAEIENKTKLVLFLSGDDVEAKRIFASALDGTGFVSVDLGGLIAGGQLTDFGAPLSGLHLDLVKRLGF